MYTTYIGDAEQRSFHRDMLRMSGYVATVPEQVCAGTQRLRALPGQWPVVRAGAQLGQVDAAMQGPLGGSLKDSCKHHITEVVVPISHIVTTK